ncbi:hypothetical protein [uncultured Slackia sp.]|uniref:hypothetical protein n=1 Tax=uncultured Slackia sp. TaxID=665903 RepID=UPI002600F3C8|nr:hypothetical protein [uncultured Slackia sp.]
MTKKLEGRVLSARRRRRGSLKPALTGLTVFSLTCLLLGSVVYAAAVPGLIMSSDTIAAVIQAPANPAVGSQRLITSVLGELIGAGGSSQEEADAKEGSSSGGAAGSSSGVVSSVGGLSSLSSVVSGTLQGSAGLDTGGEDGNKDGEDAESGSSSGNADSNKGQNDAEGDAKPDSEPNPNPDEPGSDDSKPEGPEPEPEPTPEPDGPAPEEEEAYHQLLIGYANRLNGYATRVMELRSYFVGGDAAPMFAISIDERETLKGQAEVLKSEMGGDWGSLHNSMAYKDDSQWQSSAGKLINLFMLLFRYSEQLSGAWGSSWSAGNDLASQWQWIIDGLNEAEPLLAEYNEKVNAGVGL